MLAGGARLAPVTPISCIGEACGATELEEHAKECDADLQGLHAGLGTISHRSIIAAEMFPHLTVSGIYGERKLIYDIRNY
jgi:hypothetical protein